MNRDSRGGVSDTKSKRVLPSNSPDVGIAERVPNFT